MIRPTSAGQWRLRRIRNLQDVRAAARARLPRFAFDFIDGAANDEETMAANERAFRSLVFRPKALVDVATRNQSTTVVGQRLQTPILLAPAGLARLAHYEAEVAAARAAIEHGTVFVLSSYSSSSIEHLVRAGCHSWWFQLYLWRVRARNGELLRRAEAAGCSVLVVTVDVPVLGKRERDIANGFQLPLRPKPRMALDIARHPKWASGLLRGGPITFANFTEFGAGHRPAYLWHYVNTELAHPGATWTDLDWLRSAWTGRIVIKGIMTAEDAERAVACGVDGVIVSNHGGRQLDGLGPTIGVLPEIVEAVASRIDVLIDGGIRRGSDVVKAVALGAKAVLIGRPYLYGLALTGESGVSRVLAILSDEIDTTLALIGRPRLGDVDHSCLLLADEQPLDLTETVRPR